MNPRTDWNLTSSPASTPRCLFVLFGCTGDLAARKLAPALYQLAADGLLDERCAFVGVGRRDWNDAMLREHLERQIRQFSRRVVDEAVLAGFLSRWFYQTVEMDSPDDYAALARRLDDLDAGEAMGRLFYLSLSPSFFATVAGQLKQAGLAEPVGERFARLIVEKPIGYDLTSARALNASLREAFDEPQIFRIDHYLGKETVQNILVFRFANALFETHLNAREVDRVEITTAEPLGMEGRRGAYYDAAGALRDMIQNHMLQVMALVAMDRPACLHCESVRDARAALLASIAPLSADEIARHTCRGQYVGYRNEEGVSPDSQTETYAACRLTIRNDRWAGVPFYLRTGKCLPVKDSRVVVTFRPTGDDLLAGSCSTHGTNRLVLRIAPHEGISLRFDVKRPGPDWLLRPVDMDFRYETAFPSGSPEAYEHLLLDAIRGDATLFIRGDEVEAAWRVVDSIRTGWDADLDGGVRPYDPDTWGPADADRVFGDPYVHWTEPRE